MEQQNKRKQSVRKLALLASLLALAFGLGYLDVLIPLDGLGIPGIKLGLANLAVLAALYLLGWPQAALVSLVRILLFWFVFGNFTAFLYSLCGGILSLAVMALFRKIKLFDEVGVSISGAVVHNTGQLLMAWFLTGTAAVWWYYPVLLAAGALAGALIGLLFRIVHGRVAKLLFPADSGIPA